MKLKNVLSGVVACFISSFIIYAATEVDVSIVSTILKLVGFVGLFISVMIIFSDKE